MNFRDIPQNYTTMFLDMNSFFASVEQQVQPILRGKPIGVAPYTGTTGCIIAASKEAKAFGIKVCRVDEAKKRCPEIKIIEARPALYMFYHKEIAKILESVTPYYRALSIDEFAINLSKREQNPVESIKLAGEIKKRIRERVGDYLTCSIGISASIFLAKMAAEMKKPDGLTTVKLEDLRQFYAGLSLRDLTGINWRMEARLQRFGIKSPLDLYQCDLLRLTQILKHWGKLWHFRLRGYEVDDYEIKNKTIGHSHVLAPELRTKEKALSVLQKLTFKAGYRLRKGGYSATGVVVSINFLDRQGFHLSRKVPAFFDSQSFWANVLELLKECKWRSKPILLSVAAFNLKPKKERQISIFAEIEKSRTISETLDQINDEFGADTIFPASMFWGKDSAPDRIPFGRPRYEIRNE